MSVQGWSLNLTKKEILVTSERASSLVGLGRSQGVKCGSKAWILERLYEPLVQEVWS